MIRAGVALVVAGGLVLWRAPLVLTGAADLVVWWSGIVALGAGGVLLAAAGGWRFADWAADRLEAMGGARQ